MEDAVVSLLMVAFAMGLQCCLGHLDDPDSCSPSQSLPSPAHKYKKAPNTLWQRYLNNIEEGLKEYLPCPKDDFTSCYKELIDADLSIFQEGITRDMLNSAKVLGTRYQIVGGKLYRQGRCVFPARCQGIEHFILQVVDRLPDSEFVVNDYDWPKVPLHHTPVPVFSFSKTGEYLDILYPAWSFWAGGPAISLYPTGLGRPVDAWDEHRASLSAAAEKWPWRKKKSQGFFRGSRTSSERDPLVLLSRTEPELVAAAYTKNQAWKSEADTLGADPAPEISLEDHCEYKYLFNFRGVAASFRFRHLFLCKSLVIHVGNEWTEFFYPLLRPWVHYLPLPSYPTQEQIIDILEFAKEFDKEVEEIANRGREVIWEHLRPKDITTYWEELLRSYSKLLNFKPSLLPNMTRIS
ncbi:unnamed protein product [Darwinula stevensoni]|uniref:Glycosyl transferase CAP10 domain-containing protein n=1 Tax=Darwinula stevensoni TaxID=69355 RepID=A0A7R9A932_9CRUS|nr:unnamed protein product [Darwinula stevensoni]CAG0896988.1 unnamed protein product [Darwinula stevensoni]